MEYFETFDQEGRSLGLESRDVVHRSGLWHKSAQVFVFDTAGALLIQQRSADKDLYAGLWDYSVGEHLQPGESFAAGARRGLHEELGIDNVELTALGELRRVRQRGDGYDDRELQQAFRCSWSGELRVDPIEVAATRYIDMKSLREWVERCPEDFTPWLKIDLEEFGLI